MDFAGDVVKATGKSIQVVNSLQPMETGWINWKYTYTYKNGKFKLKSSTAAAKSSLGNHAYDEDGYRALFKKNKYVVANTRSFYTGTDLKKVAFTAERNDKLTLKKIKISGDKVYLQFQKGKKTGWQQVDNSGVYDFRSSDPGSTGWFYGVYKRLVG
ncbi:MAG TPA: hypothetical protein DF613_17535 [Lachnospiraceae bacterium]|nr:hypothetical protein [Lachnospiraceae bacterium]